MPGLLVTILMRSRGRTKPRPFALKCPIPLLSPPVHSTRNPRSPTAWSPAHRPQRDNFQPQGAQKEQGVTSLAVQWLRGFPGGSAGKEPACQCKRHKRLEFNPWAGKTPWRRALQPTPLFLPGKFHGQRSLAGCSPQGLKESDMTECTYML